MKTRTPAILAAAIALGMIAVTAIEPAHADPGASRARPTNTAKPARTAPTTGTRAASQPAKSPPRRASARDAANSRAAKGEHRKKLKQMIFELGDEVEGGVAGPNHDTVTARGQLVHSNLIRVREDFLAEIHKSVESL